MDPKNRPTSVPVGFAREAAEVDERGVEMDEGDDRGDRGDMEVAEKSLLLDKEEEEREEEEGKVEWLGVGGINENELFASVDKDGVFDSTGCPLRGVLGDLGLRAISSKYPGRRSNCSSMECICRSRGVATFLRPEDGVLTGGFGIPVTSS